MSKNRPGIDQHIVIALEHIHWPIVTPKGKKFFIRKNARDRTGIEHIAEKRHHLKIVDIEVLPSLLANPLRERRDPTNKSCWNYMGRRRGKQDRPFLKVITMLNQKNRNEETIVTIYPIKSLN